MPVVLAAALAQPVPIIALHLTRPAVEIPDRAALGMASHLEAPYAGQASLPVTERIAATSFQLPMHPGLTEIQQTRVIAALRKVLEA